MILMAIQDHALYEKNAITNKYIQRLPLKICKQVILISHVLNPEYYPECKLFYLFINSNDFPSASSATTHCQSEFQLDCNHNLKKKGTTRAPFKSIIIQKTYFFEVRDIWISSIDIFFVSGKYL